MPKKASQPNEGSAAAWVLAVRTAAQMSQEAFAAKLKVDRVTVSNWERGDAEPSWQNYQRIKSVFPDAPPPPGQKTQPTGSAGLSDPSGKLPSSLEGYLERHKDDLSDKERRFLTNYRGMPEAGAPPPDEQMYDDLLRVYRAFRLRRDSREGGGGSR